MEERNFYRLKFEYLTESEDGSALKKKEEYLVTAVNYSDAEARAMKFIALLQTIDESSIKYEIVKTNIKDILLTDSFSIERNDDKTVEYYFSEDEKESALYVVNVEYEIVINDKIKKEKGQFYVASENAKSAYEKTQKFLKRFEVGRDWSIKGIKFDKAETILITESMHESNVLSSKSCGIFGN